MTNVGTIPATEITFNLSATPSSVLANEASMCVTSTGLGTNGNDYVLYNGPLSGGLKRKLGAKRDTLTVGGSYTNTAARRTTTSSTSTPVLRRRSAAVRFTANDVISNEGTLANASTGATGTPGPSAAPTLQNGAEGGSVTLTATTTYQG